MKEEGESFPEFCDCCGVAFEVGVRYPPLTKEGEDGVFRYTRSAMRSAGQHGVAQPTNVTRSDNLELPLEQVGLKSSHVQ